MRYRLFGGEYESSWINHYKDSEKDLRQHNFSSYNPLLSKEYHLQTFTSKNTTNGAVVCRQLYHFQVKTVNRKATTSRKRDKDKKEAFDLIQKVCDRHKFSKPVEKLSCQYYSYHRDMLENEHYKIETIATCLLMSLEKLQQ